jgi:hypothetical protein
LLIGDAQILLDRFFQLCLHHNNFVKNLSFPCLESIMQSISSTFTEALEKGPLSPHLKNTFIV